MTAMFAYRQSSQKPSDELFEKFRQSFPAVRGASTSSPADGSVDAIVTTMPDSLIGGTTKFEDLDPTPRAALAESFRFTPSMITPSAFMDPNSSAFAAFADQPAGLFTPTPGNTNGINGTHPSMGSISTNGMGLTPMSLTALAPASTADVMSYAPPQTLHSNGFQNFGFNQPLLYMDHQYGHPPSGPGSPMDLGDAELFGESMGSVAVMQNSIPTDSNAKTFDAMSHLMRGPEKFRFHVVLGAPTAMIKSPEEIPVTYLNKGQAYVISITDTNPPPPNADPVQYRTFIRISFHDATQRGRPEQCWQLWKEGRGSNEAHQRGGKLQAVEFVETQASEDDPNKARVELDSFSFDGFSVIWTPSPSGAAETQVSVRFNFLSTDFSHSKGVKGIPVRLCAKTETLSRGSNSPSEALEICYCKVKLFRDHGAERKLANDVLHVKKTIEKLKASQMDGTSMKVFSKKGSKKETEDYKIGKVQKHKRTWSVSSASSVGGRAQEEDANAKLQVMEDMFTSTRQLSILYLRADEQDDPDAYPVRLPGQWSRRGSIATSTRTASSYVSPTPSSRSLSQRAGSYSPDVPVRVSTDGVLSGWIEAIGIDQSYKPPPSPPRAVMCLYILPLADTTSNFYRAVYLPTRTAGALGRAVAAKCAVDPNSVARLVHVSEQGMKVLVDDEFVGQMREGQDLKVAVEEVDDPSAGGWTNGDAEKMVEVQLMF